MCQLCQPGWGLPLARSIADEIAGSRPSIRALIRELYGDDIEIRKRAADVVRRITERDSQFFEPYADQLTGLLSELPLDESRTRWHLALVVPRIVHTRPQRLRAARMMLSLAEDESNVVRCSAVEGMVTLALAEASLRDDAEAMVQSFLRTGTPAMKSKARHWEKKLRAVRTEAGQ